MPLCSEEAEQGVLVVDSWTEPQNRGNTTGISYCWWRKKFGFRKAKARESKSVRSPPEHVTWNVSPLQNKTCFGSSPAGCLNGWHVDAVMELRSYNDVPVVGGVRV
jgi:hypothetical protein